MADRFSGDESLSGSFDSPRHSLSDTPGPPTIIEPIGAILHDPPPQTFMKWTHLQAVMEGACQDLIRSIMYVKTCSSFSIILIEINCRITKSDGTPLLFAGDQTVMQGMSGLIAHIWMSFELDGREAVGAQRLQMQELALGKGTLLTTEIAGFLLVALSHRDAPAALVRRQLLSLKANLQDPFDRIFPSA
jgi:hypothetical protein